MSEDIKEVKLMKCPWCGGKVEFDEYRPTSSNTLYFIECRNHKCNILPHTNSYHSKEEAAEEWNNRDTDKKLREFRDWVCEKHALSLEGLMMLTNIITGQYE